MKNLKSKIILFIGLIGFVSCSNEDKNVAPELTVEEAKNIVLADDAINSLFKFVEADASTAAKGEVASTTSSCFLKNVIDISLGKKITFNFGTGCDFFGETFKGSLEIVYKAVDGGYSKMLTFQGFSINGVEFSGSSDYTFILKNDAGNFAVNTKADLIVKLTDGSVITKKGSWAIEKTAGSDTVLDIRDDVYETSGSWESISKDGFVRNVTITNNLVTSFGCIYIKKGVVSIVKGGKQYAIDFGDGTCDNTATFTNSDGSKTDFSM